MAYVKDELDVLSAKATEYKLTADLATDPVKRQQYEWLANEMRDLVKRAVSVRVTLPIATAASARFQAEK